VAHSTDEITIKTPGQGLHEITTSVQALVDSSSVRSGLCTVFIPHTSASLILQENADPTARSDLEDFLLRLVPEGDPHFTHTLEGADDMPAHIKSALTQSSISIPIHEGRLALGTWQGIYLWEHRRGRSRRRIVVHISGD
jgi:secondary thiamine-phosphate synthase enzyme